MGGHLALVQGLSASKHQSSVLSCQLGVSHNALVIGDRFRDVLPRFEGLLLRGHKVIDRVLCLLGPGRDLLAQVVSFVVHLLGVKSDTGQLLGGLGNTLVNLSLERGFFELGGLEAILAESDALLWSDTSFDLVTITLEGRPVDVGNALVKLVASASMSSLCLGLLCRTELVLELVLCSDAGWNHLGHRQCKNLGVLFEQEHNPVVAEGTVFDVPGLGFSVPCVAASDRGCDLLVGEATGHLLVGDEAAT